MEAPSYPISEEEVAYLSPPLPDVRGLHPVQKQFVALYEDIYEARVDENHKEPLYDILFSLWPDIPERSFTFRILKLQSANPDDPADDTYIAVLEVNRSVRTVQLGALATGDDAPDPDEIIGVPLAVGKYADDDDWKLELTEPERIPNVISLLVLHLGVHFQIGEEERGVDGEGLLFAGEMARGEKVLVFDEQGEKLFGGQGIEVVMGEGLVD